MGVFQMLDGLEHHVGLLGIRRFRELKKILKGFAKN